MEHYEVIALLVLIFYNKSSIRLCISSCHIKHLLLNKLLIVSQFSSYET
jgi:hypothetical protein